MSNFPVSSLWFFLNWLLSLPVFILSVPLTRAVTHTCKVKRAQGRLGVALRPSLLPPLATCSPSARTLFLSNASTDPAPLSAPQSFPPLSPSRRCLPLFHPVFLLKAPNSLDLVIPQCCCRIGDIVQGYGPLLPAYV